MFLSLLLTPLLPRRGGRERFTARSSSSIHSLPHTLAMTPRWGYLCNAGLGMVEPLFTRAYICRWPRWTSHNSLRRTQPYIFTSLQYCALLWLSKSESYYSPGPTIHPCWSNLNTNIIQWCLLPVIFSHFLSLSKSGELSYYNQEEVDIQVLSEEFSCSFNALKYQVFKIFLLKVMGCDQYKSRY